MLDTKAFMCELEGILYGKSECSKAEIIKGIVMAVKSAIGTDAVGIRFKEGDDFPYYTTIGFSESFVIAEQSLCGRDSSGNILRDKDGNAILACTCGAMMRGKIGYGFPGCTKGGSLCTNNTSQLLASIPKDGLPPGFRGRCHKDGYESVCLVPIKCKGNIIGLLQANSHRQNAFDDGTPEALEGVCEMVGEVMGPLLNAEASAEVETRRMAVRLEESISELKGMIEAL